MSSKTTAFANALVRYIFNGTAIPGLTGALYCALHTADPGVGGNQSTSEAGYDGYARVVLDRSTTEDFSVSGAVATLTADIAFPASTEASTTLTHFSIGTGAGADMILYRGQLVNSDGDAQPIIVTPGTVPILLAATSVTEA